MTPRQKEIFDFIHSYISNRGFAPTYKEIMQSTGIRYKSQCFGLLKNLEQQGKITIDKAKARGISICKGTVREKEQIKRLQKQLEIAVKCLKQYADRDNWYNTYKPNSLDECPIAYKERWKKEYGYKQADKVLKKIEELNK